MECLWAGSEVKFVRASALPRSEKNRRQNITFRLSLPVSVLTDKATTEVWRTIHRQTPEVIRGKRVGDSNHLSMGKVVDKLLLSPVL